METGVTVSVMIIIILVMLLIFAIVAYCYITHTLNEKAELNAELTRTRNEAEKLINEREILLRFPQKLQGIINEQDLDNSEKLQKIIYVLDKYRY